MDLSGLGTEGHLLLQKRDSTDMDLSLFVVLGVPYGSEVHTLTFSLSAFGAPSYRRLGPFAYKAHIEHARLVRWLGCIDSLDHTIRHPYRSGRPAPLQERQS